ncbi:MAG: CTP synthase [Bacillales bacterium]|jgi:CTP synthase|nr:CTP synthase [Bacillales bacterium]
MSKYIFVTGGVISGLGKGITAASLGRLLKSHGLSVFVLKCDPYLNVDTSNMSPIQHGEVFVTKDGGETDLDLGHYERFIDVELTKISSLTTGKIYQSIINKERQGLYNGATIQIIPHVTNEIKQEILTPTEDIVIVEIGGTVGDIESLPFLDAIRQLRREKGRENTLFIHVTLLPFVEASGELKTKPTQHSVKELRSLGIQPDVLVLRTNMDVDDEIRSKISSFCDVDMDCVFVTKDVKNIYEVPSALLSQKLDQKVLKQLNITHTKLDFSIWQNLLDVIHNRNCTITIGLVGKYIALHDSYLSVVEALKHAGYKYGCKIRINWISSEVLSPETSHTYLKDLDGIIVPGGFGPRGMLGMIEAVRYARVNKVPFFGICLGMQMVLLEYARNILNIKEATSTEIDKNSSQDVITYLFAKKMRIGEKEINIVNNTLASRAYNSLIANERYRHRYGLNPNYQKQFMEGGLIISGTSDEGRIAEIVELANHPFFLGVQSHPEFKSRPTKEHPLFSKFIEASYQNYLKKRETK